MNSVSKIMIAGLTAAAFLSTPAIWADDQAEVKFTLSNDTANEVTFCIAYLDDDLDSWVTEGYWRITSQGKTTVSMNTTHPAVYYWATSDSSTWGQDATFSVSLGLAFTIKEADSDFPSFARETTHLNHDANAEMGKREFNRVLVTKGSKRVSRRLVTDECELDHYAAIANSWSTGSYGYAHSYHTLEEAQLAAISQCGGADASVVIWSRNGWCALAMGDGGSRGWAQADTPAEAESQALDECSKRAGGCYIAACVDANQ